MANTKHNKYVQCIFLKSGKCSGNKMYSRVERVPDCWGDIDGGQFTVLSRVVQVSLTEKVRSGKAWRKKGNFTIRVAERRAFQAEEMARTKL